MGDEVLPPHDHVAPVVREIVLGDEMGPELVRHDFPHLFRGERAGREMARRVRSRGQGVGHRHEGRVVFLAQQKPADDAVHRVEQLQPGQQVGQHGGQAHLLKDHEAGAAAVAAFLQRGARFFRFAAPVVFGLFRRHGGLLYGVLKNSLSSTQNLREPQRSALRFS